MILNRKISVAPMMSYTDRHFRVLMRLINSKLLLYTEMVTAPSLVRGKNAVRALSFSPIERPLALQLGGCDPGELAICAKMAADMGYDEINLNVGCPSDRVRSGHFGACLMKQPGLVAECVHNMKSAVAIPVTVKTRIGVDQQDSYEELCHFIKRVHQAGCGTFIIHARKAWLKGLSPHQNRTVPPLRYDVVYQLKKDFPDLEIVMNGGIQSWQEIEAHLQQVDGVMIGRAAYQNPFFLVENSNMSRSAIIIQYLDYVAAQLEAKAPLWNLTRHLMSLYQGQPGAKNWRRQISEQRLGSTELRVLLSNLESKS